MDTTIFQKFYEEKTALINPTDCTKPIDNFPEVCISTFSKNIIDKFISLNSVQKIAELYTANGVNPVYKINYKGKEIAFYLSLVGASACVSGLEEIIALGAKKIILFGSCGILRGSKIGNIPKRRETRSGERRKNRCISSPPAEVAHSTTCSLTG